MVKNTMQLVSWGNGMWVMGVFALVCIVLVIVVVNLINSDKK